MAKRFATFHFPRGSNEAAAVYLAEDHEPLVVEIHSDVIQGGPDAEFGIYSDGASIMACTPCISSGESAGEEDSFTTNNIVAGSWITCRRTGGGEGNMTVQLELESIEE
jgi:hypothetical protein